MTCFDIDLFFDQLGEREPEEWFVLHMLGCEECRENFQFACMIRAVLQEQEGGETPEATGESLDQQARLWMTWMTGDKPPNREAVQ